MAASGEHPNRKEGFGPGASAQQQQEEAEEEAGAGEQLNGKAGSWRVGWPTPCIDDITVCFFVAIRFPTQQVGILAEGAIALSVTLSGGVLFAS